MCHCYVWKIYCSPSKWKKDLFTLKEMPVKVQKRMNCGKNSYKFFNLSEAMVIIISQKLSAFGGSNLKNFFNFHHLRGILGNFLLLRINVSLKVFWYVICPRTVKGIVSPISIYEKKKWIWLSKDENILPVWKNCCA